MKAKKTQMEQTTITSIILADDNTPFGDRTKNKGKDITRLLLQNPNGLDLGQDGLTLHENIDSSIKYDIHTMPTRDKYELQESTNLYNFQQQYHQKWKGSSTYISQSTIQWSSSYKPDETISSFIRHYNPK